MKTLVVIELNGSLVSLLLSEMTTVPAEGRSYTFEGRRYKVTETNEFLGVRSASGNVLSGSEKLLSVLTSVYGDDMKVAAMLSGIKGIGAAGTATSTTPGGLILPNAPMAEDFDHVLFVRVEPFGKNRAMPQVKLAKFAAGQPEGAQSLVAKPTKTGRRTRKTQRS